MKTTEQTFDQAFDTHVDRIARVVNMPEPGYEAATAMVEAREAFAEAVELAPYRNQGKEPTCGMDRVDCARYHNKLHQR